MNGVKILMHKNDKVCECKFDSRGYLENVSKIYTEDLLPVGVGGENINIEMQKWILSRSIAQNRKDIGALREFYGSDTFIPQMGLSLFDCYWFSNDGEPIWEHVNAFDNWDCRMDSVYLMLARPEEKQGINYNSPNLTVPGRDPRIWYRMDEGDVSGADSPNEDVKELCLLYSNAQAQMALYKKGIDNPVVAKRTYVILHNNIYARVSAYTSKEREIVSLDALYHTVYDPQKSNMENLAHCCEHYEIPGWKEFFTNMTKFDEAIGNTERELSDVYVLRDSNTLKIIGFAPL